MYGFARDIEFSGRLNQGQSSPSDFLFFLVLRYCLVRGVRGNKNAAHNTKKYGDREFDSSIGSQTSSCVHVRSNRVWTHFIVLIFLEKREEFFLAFIAGKNMIWFPTTRLRAAMTE